jgi:hypothetical protein
MNKIISIISLIVLINSLFSDNDRMVLEGTYQIRPGFNITITKEADGLYVDPDRQPKEKLTKLTDSLYKIKSIDGTVDFSLILNKKEERLVIRMFGKTIHAPRLPLIEEEKNREEIEITESVLESYEGEYEVSEGQMFYINADDGLLWIQLTGQQGAEAYPFAENKFFFKVVDASIEFIKDENGDIDYLLIFQSGVILQADRKQ